MEIHIKENSLIERLVPDQARLRILFINLYLYGTRSSWVLIDAGLRKSAGTIVRATEDSFGEGTAPEAIILTHGHVSLFREQDRCLIAGDAFVTVEQESLYEVATQKQEVHGPPSYFTPDWDAAHQSVERLAALKPATDATGHGKPMHGQDLRRGLDTIAADFDRIAVPERGRYVGGPAPFTNHRSYTSPLYCRGNSRHAKRPRAAHLLARARAGAANYHRRPTNKP